MKANPYYLYLIFISIIIMTSCTSRTHNMLTTIHENGSATRTFNQLADSVFLIGDTSSSNPFPFVLDSSWTITWQYDTMVRTSWPAKNYSLKGDTKASIYAEKNFTTVDEMAEFDFLNSGEWKPLKTEILYERKFRWFYTYYYFRETFPSIDIFDKIPVTAYISEEKAMMWLQGNGYTLKGMNGLEFKSYLDEVEKQFDLWFNRSLFEEYIDIIVKNIELFDAPGINSSMILTQKDSIYKLYEKNHEELLESDFHIMDEYFDTRAFTRAFEEHEILQTKLDSVLLFTELFSDELEYSLLMPGKVLYTNAINPTTDTLLWKVDAYRFALFDYDLIAESRKPNWWAFLLSSLVVLTAFGLYFGKINR